MREATREADIGLVVAWVKIPSKIQAGKSIRPLPGTKPYQDVLSAVQHTFQITQLIIKQEEKVKVIV